MNFKVTHSTSQLFAFLIVSASTFCFSLTGNAQSHLTFGKGSVTQRASQSQTKTTITPSSGCGENLECGEVFLSDPGFENNPNSCVNLVQSQVLSECWEIYCGTPDTWGGDCSGGDSFDGDPNNLNYIGLYNQHIWEEAVKTELAEPLTAGDYTISFWARPIEDDVYDFDAMVANISIGLGYDFTLFQSDDLIDFDFNPDIYYVGTVTAPYDENEVWVEYSLDFTYSGGTPATVLFLGYDGNIANEPEWWLTPYVQIDGVSLHEQIAEVEIVEIDPICPGDVIQLNVTPSGTAGVFSGSGVLPGLPGEYWFYADSTFPPGEYEIQYDYIDEFGCSQTLYATVEVMDVCECYEIGFDLVILSQEPYGCETNMGSATVDATGLGDINTTFVWYDEAGEIEATGETATDLFPGEYLVVATNSAGCTTDIIVEIEAVNWDIDYSPVSCYGAMDGSIGFELVGAQEPVTYYLWSAEPGNEITSLENLGDEAVLIIGVDQSSCEYSIIVDVDEPPLIEIQGEIINNCDNFGEICVSANGGIGSFTYNWDNGDTGPCTSDDLPIGTYVVTVEDQIGCQMQQSFDILENCAQPFCRLIRDNGITSGDIANVGNSVSVAGNGSYMIGGTMNETSLEADHYFAQFNSSSDVLYHGRIGDLDYVRPREEILDITSYGNIQYAVGYSSKGSKDVVVHRIEDDGTGIMLSQDTWRYDFGGSESANAVVYVPVGFSGDPELYIAGTANVDGHNDMFIMRVNPTTGDMYSANLYYTNQNDECMDMDYHAVAQQFILVGVSDRLASAVRVAPDLSLMSAVKIGNSSTNPQKPSVLNAVAINQSSGLVHMAGSIGFAGVDQNMLYINMDLALTTVNEQLLIDGISSSYDEMVTDMILGENNALFFAGGISTPGDEAGWLVSADVTGSLNINWSRQSVYSTANSDDFFHGLDILPSNEILATGYFEDQNETTEIFEVRAGIDGESCCLTDYSVFLQSLPSTLSGSFDIKPFLKAPIPYGVWAPDFLLQNLCESAGKQSKSENLEEDRVTAAVMPNPTEDRVLVSLLNSSSSIVAIHMVNQLGQTVVLDYDSTLADRADLSLEQFGNGVYILQVHLEDGRILQQRIIVSR